MLQGLLTTLIPIVVAALTTTGFEYLQKLVTIIDALPAMAKQVIVGVSAYLLTAAAAALGVHLVGGDITTLNPGDISALASATLAFIFKTHANQKAA